MVMKSFIGLICLLFFIGYSPGNNTPMFKPDTADSLKSYSRLVLENVTTLPASLGVKSVLFNSTGTKLYALNLEGMSIYEFDQTHKNVTRKFEFKATRATGWNYALNKPMPSFAEKPVEGCFSQGDKILWVSLHNAGGIVPIILDSAMRKISAGPVGPKKTLYIESTITGQRDSVELPLIKTGIMPKVIEKTADEQLLVSNWGSKTVSVLKLNDSIAPYINYKTTISMPAIPRGIAVDDKNHCAYVGIMGGNTIKAVCGPKWKIKRSFKVSENPRHIILDKQGRLFASFNVISQIACIDTKTGKVLFKTSTNPKPRTIAISENQKFLFVTCYGGNTIDIFKINNRSFTKVFALKCPGKPVGIALYEDNDKLEAWACNYWTGNLRVYTFRKF